MKPNNNNNNNNNFITFVTFERKEFLHTNIDLLRKAFIQTKQKYDFEIIAICVLKNQVHILIKPNIINNYPNIIFYEENWCNSEDINQINELDYE